MIKALTVMVKAFFKIFPIGNGKSFLLRMNSVERLIKNLTCLFYKGLRGFLMSVSSILTLFN